MRLDGLRASLADGTVVLGGRLGLDGLALTDYDVTLTGHDLRLRYPEGMRSLVDATLALQGPVSAAVLERIGDGAIGRVGAAVRRPTCSAATAERRPSPRRRWPAR